jgi:hypothetical protein
VNETNSTKKQIVMTMTATKRGRVSGDLND